MQSSLEVEIMLLVLDTCVLLVNPVEKIGINFLLCLTEEEGSYFATFPSLCVLLYKL